jgi:hypothetical protein
MSLTTKQALDVAGFVFFLALLMETNLAVRRQFGPDNPPPTGRGVPGRSAVPAQFRSTSGPA